MPQHAGNSVVGCAQFEPVLTAVETDDNTSGFVFVPSSIHPPSRPRRLQRWKGGGGANTHQEVGPASLGEGIHLRGRDLAVAADCRPTQSSAALRLA